MISPPPTQRPFNNSNGEPEEAWTEWALNVRSNVKYAGSDTTANRPTNGLTDGMFFMDTTLGKPIWYYNGGWIDATGASV